MDCLFILYGCKKQGWYDWLLPKCDKLGEIVLKSCLACNAYSKFLSKEAKRNNSDELHPMFLY